MSVPAEVVRQQIGNIPPYLEAAFKEAAERAQGLSRQEYRPYRGQRLAQKPQSLANAEWLAQQTGSFYPHLLSAQQHIQHGAQTFPQGYQAYMNPYQEAVVKNIAKHGKRVFKEKIMPELDARFLRLGQFGSSRHAKLSRKAARDMQKEISSQQEEAMSKGYQHAMQGFNWDKARALEAATLMTKIGIANQAGQLADIGALRDSGLLEQEHQQRLRDLEYEQWKEAQRHPYEALSHYLSVLQGTPFVPSAYVRSEFTRPPQSMHGGDWRNLGFNMVGDWLFNRSGRARGGRINYPRPRKLSLPSRTLGLGRR